MVLKTEIAKSVEEQKRFLANKQFGQKRDVLADLSLVSEFVLIITGIRRCGKSTLMQQLSQQLNTEFAFFNFEDSRVFGFEVSDFPKLLEVFGENTEYFFFDEIQNVDSWEVFIRSLNDKQKKICVTGSNASMLSKELGTKLTGRNIQIELFPFAYSEFCAFLKLEKNENSFTQYLEIGGFPDYIQTQKKEYLQQLFKDIIYRDIIVRHGIRNAKVVLDLALFLISNTAKEYSLNSLKKTFEIGSANSVMHYVEWFEDTYMLFSLPRFSWLLKSVSINPKKIYTIDTGFAQANSLSFSKNQGRLLENAVYLALRRKHKELYYFKEKGECDFVVKEGSEILDLIQVCTEITTENLKREVDGLVEALVFFDKPEGTIVTLNQEDLLEKDGKKIQLIPAWKWF